ncbi:hypothetical protein ACIGXM_14055 [Kitasatospora sp. NPDC052896]|uniref:hypothetical protein n=1 Tax=Kitasatospora sp. NPDC052896 TaxID=3364061 RepID=UPI0037C72E70
MSDRQHTEAPRKVTTAFLILQTEQGEWEATPDLDMPLQPSRPASVSDMKHGAAEVVSDIEASKIAAMAAQLTIQQQMQMAASIRNRAEEQAIRSKLVMP